MRPSPTLEQHACPHGPLHAAADLCRRQRRLAKNLDLSSRSALLLVGYVCGLRISQQEQLGHPEIAGVLAKLQGTPARQARFCSQAPQLQHVKVTSTQQLNVSGSTAPGKRPRAAFSKSSAAARLSGPEQQSTPAQVLLPYAQLCVVGARAPGNRPLPAYLVAICCLGPCLPEQQSIPTRQARSCHHTLQPWPLAVLMS